MNRIEVRFASLLHTYTGGRANATAAGSTLGEVLDDLEVRFPGLRFRIVDEQSRPRPHIRFFINQSDARTLAAPVADGDEVYLVGALSGG